MYQLQLGMLEMGGIELAEKGNQEGAESALPTVFRVLFPFCKEGEWAILVHTTMQRASHQRSAQPGNLDAGVTSVCLSFPSFSASNSGYVSPLNWPQLRHSVSRLSPLTSPRLHCFLLVLGPALAATSRASAEWSSLIKVSSRQSVLEDT